ncbi:MAG: galactose-1-phosphate uridylyltransferase [Candidatus Muiribacteriota bacterium]
MAELRKDPVSQRWIIISDKELNPEDYLYNEAKNSNNTENCPFCDKNSHMIEKEILRTSYNNRWAARIVNNKFPALISEVELEKEADGVYDKMSGYGYHEVIIDSYEHFVPFHKTSPEKIEKVLEAMVKRYRELKKDKNLKYVLFFKNYGASAGASLSHSHAQLVATPVVPKIVMNELLFSKKYFNYKERCLFCDLINQEKKDKERLITFNQDFYAFVPYAPRFPFETWILPELHNSSFGNIKNCELKNLAVIIKECINRLEKVFKNLPFNFVIHTAPFENNCGDYYHWHIEIMPRLTKVAGFEWGSGFYVNETSPEKAAGILREAF